MERLDIAHNLFTSAFHRLHTAPLREPISKDSDTRILDIGTGTGIWAIEMAESVKHPSSKGIDHIVADKKCYTADIQMLR